MKRHWLAGLAAILAVAMGLHLYSQNAGLPKPEFAESRSKLLGTIPLTRPGAFEFTPNADGDYVYEATSAKLMVEGCEGVNLAMDPDTGVKGLATVVAGRQEVRYGGMPRLNGVCWRLKGIKPGQYWVGLLIKIGAFGNGIECALPTIRPADIFLNGRQVPCSTLSDPIQVAPGVWFAEAQAAGDTALREGDEISVVGDHVMATAPVARLILHAKEPYRGAFKTCANPGPTNLNQNTSLGIAADIGFVAAPGKPIYGGLFSPSTYQQQWMETPDDFLRAPDGRAIARCSLSNPLPVPVEVDYQCVVKGHYLQEGGRDSARLMLPPHFFVTREVLFTTTPDDSAYSITAQAHAVKRPDLNWPAYDELTLFPGYRQLMPWTNPFDCIEHRRVVFKQTVRSPHERLALFGQWERALKHDLDAPMPPPANLKFAPVSVPGEMDNKLSDNTVYVRRKFTLPKDQGPAAAQIVVDIAGSEATAYVNGKRVGNVRGGCMPLIGDATEAVRPGENEVTLVLRSKMAVMNPKYVDLENSKNEYKYMDAPGDGNSRLSVSCAWSGKRGVWLELSPLVSSRDLKVETSFRKSTVTAKFTVANGLKSDADLRVRVTVEDARKPILAVGEQELSLKPGESKPLEFTKEWRDPRLWSWQEPNLYVLAVELTDAKSGSRLDLNRERFGFRETWLQDGQLYFNGHPVRLKCVSTTTSSLDRDRKFGIQVGRGACDPDWADETGQMATDLVTALVNSPSKYNVESDAFWDTTDTDVQIAVRREWNHPSILAWDLSNEWFGFTHYVGCNMKQSEGRFMKLSDTVHKLDPTRWTFYNGDGDIDGLLDNYCAHYPFSCCGQGIWGSHSVYLPDSAYYRPLPRDFLSNEWIEALKWRVGSKPILDGEDLWYYGNNLPPATTKFGGEEIVLAGIIGGGPNMLWRVKQDFDGQRDLGMALHSTHDLSPGSITRGFPLQVFLMPDVIHHGFAGQKMTKPYSLLNDLFRPAKLALKWTLVGPDGATAAGDVERQDLSSGQTKRGAISFTLPAVSQRTKYTLQLRLESDGVFVYGEDRDVDVWPDAAIRAGELTRKIMLHDPKGDTAKAIKEAGVEFETAKTLAAPEGDPSGWVFVVGEETLNESTSCQAEALGKFVDSGGRVIMLAQKYLPMGLPASVSNEGREWTSQPYVRLPIHPVLEGITSWDLHFWAPDRVSARRAYSKPDGGTAIPLVDSGRETGLEYVELMEMYRGKGLYLLCQLSLVEKYGTEPMARELLARVLRYSGGKDAFRSPVKRLRLMAARNSVLERKMKDTGVAYDLVSPDSGLNVNSPTMVEGGTTPAPADLASWKSYLSDGATLVVANATAQDAKWLSDLAGAAVNITVPRYRMWEGRGCRNGFDVLTAGLSQLDLFWKRYDALACTVEDPSFMIEQLQNASAEIAGSRELVFPGALVEAKVGKGQIVLDERRWTTANDKLEPLAGRNLSALALGLNVAVAMPAPPRALPADITYRPIDLTPCANRSFADDVADDGKGGWTDQGPDADLRSFPTGKQSFGNVPFTIGSCTKSIVVLASENRPGKENMPWDVTVPIDGVVEGLYFIHGAAYCGDGQNVGLYHVNYADGSTEDIPVIGGRNVRDWADPNTGGFARERHTRTVVAWTGKCKAFPSTSVYMMLWVNPVPDKPVVSVRFSNPTRQGVIGLIGLTAVSKKGANEPTVPLAQAQQLLKQAQEAIKSGKTDLAKSLLKKAIAASPEFMDAHQALADLCEQGGKDDELLEVYRQWTDAGAKTPLPWNRLGEILEKRKDYKGALEAYKRSLKIEWNQPPALEAKARLEKLVKQ